MRTASTILGAGVLGTMIEAVSTILDDCWDANKSNANTLYYLQEAIKASDTGSVRTLEQGEISTMIERGTYWDNNQMTVTFDSEQPNYNYVREGPPREYMYPYSCSRDGIQFTRMQIEFLANSPNRRYDLIQTEFNAKMKGFMTWQNRQILFAPGAPALGTGAYVPAFDIWDIYGARQILNNATLYYNVARPGTGELWCTNTAGTVVGANGLYPQISRWQSAARNNNEPVPTILVAPEWSRQNFISEMQNVYASAAAGVRQVFATQDNNNLRFRFDGVDFMEWGNEFGVIFEPLMPGGGAQAVNNEFLFINPNYVDVKYLPGRDFAFDPFDKGGMANPNVYFTNIYLGWVVHWKVPKAHQRHTGVTLPAV